MYGFILMLLILDAFLLLLVVLLQSGKGGGLAAEFGGASSSADTFLGGRQAATLLTKASWVTGGLFMGLALLLAILSARTRAPSSVLEGQLTPAVEEAPAPLLEREQAQEAPGVIDLGEEGAAESGEEGQPPPQGGN
ncbi:MAG: preprotein translocase subunit SecG [Gemmatimonadales bacterium]|jgi:preprotein translocase subunit SecG